MNFLNWTTATPNTGVDLTAILVYSICGVLLAGALIAIAVILLKERARRKQERENLENIRTTVTTLHEESEEGEIKDDGDVPPTDLLQ